MSRLTRSVTLMDLGALYRANRQTYKVRVGMAESLG